MDNNNELDVNKRNREQSEQIMSEGKRNLDGYWDSHNPIVLIVLLVLGLIIVGGVIYYIIVFLNGNY